MSWFRKGNEKLSENDLIAYHLQELPPRHERAVARALEASATLAADSAAVEAVLRAVNHTPGPVEQAAYTRTWARLQPALRPYSAPKVVHPRWRTPVLAGAALAGVAAVSVVVIATTHHHEIAHEHVANALPAETGRPAWVIGDSAEQGDRNAIAGTPRPAYTGTGRPAPRPSLDGPRPTLSSREHAHGTPLPEALHVPSLAQLPPLASAQATPEAPLRQEPDAAARSADTDIPHNSPAGDAARKGDHAADAGNNPHKPVPRDRPSSVDIMLALGGTFIAPHSSLVAKTEPRTQTATPAIAALAALHQQFRPALGYRLTLSYTRPEFDYTYQSEGGGIDSRIFEAAGTYVVGGPHHGKLSTSVDAGAALLAFLPTARPPAVSYAYRSAAVVGASAEYAVGRHWGARVTYRAQIFRGPGFRDTSGTVPIATSIVVSHEPAVGIVYRFGPGKARSTMP